MTTSALRLALAALAALTLAAASPARAAPPAGAPRAAGELSGLLIFGAGYGYGAGYHDGFGIGGRYRMALVPEGLLAGRAQVRDELDLEFGADLVRYDYGYRVAPFNYNYSWSAFRPRAGLMWDFWLSPQFALYPKLDLGYEFGWFDGWDPNAGPRPSYAGLFLEPSIGLIWRFRPATSLRLELGSEGLKLGLGFTL
jgi:hypothetical protein